MNQNEAIEIKRTIEGAYPKFTEIKDSLFIILMGEYDYETMQVACVNLIKTRKFPPTIAEIIEEYKKTTVERRSLIIDKMRAAGYFTHQGVVCEEEYRKSIVFVESGVIPPFLMKMIQQFLRKNKEIEGVKNEIC